MKTNLTCLSVAFSLATLAMVACSSAASPAPTTAQPSPSATSGAAGPTPAASISAATPAPAPTETPGTPAPTPTPPAGAIRRLTDEELQAELSSVRFSTRAWPRTDFRVHSVSLQEFRGGGPGKDDIPPIDGPSFITVGEAEEWLEDREPVQVVSINGDARAYPLQILVWHEIVNDVVGGEPVTVTY